MLAAHALGREVPRNSMITQSEVSHIWLSRCMDMKLKMVNTCFLWTVVLVPEERFLKEVQLRQLLVSSSYLLTHGLPSTCNGNMNVCIIFVALPKANQARQMAWLQSLLIVLHFRLANLSLIIGLFGKFISITVSDEMWVTGKSHHKAPTCSPVGT